MSENNNKTQDAERESAETTADEDPIIRRRRELTDFLLKLLSRRA